MLRFALLVFQLLLRTWQGLDNSHFVPAQRLKDSFSKRSS